MALSKEKKTDVLNQVSELLDQSKMTVFVKYTGTSVKSLQQLRADAKSNGTTIKVVKNRLLKKALLADNRFKDIDSSIFTDQLLYAFNSNDEVAAAQTIAGFAKDQPQISFVGGLSEDGQLHSAEDIKALAALPSKDQLRAQAVAIIGAPISSFVSVLSANLRGVLNVLNARSEQVN